MILVSLDTLRADRLDAYGYSRGTSPNIAALAKRSVVFERAQAQSSQTAPSHASLLTSRYVGVHGIINVHGPQASFPTLPAGLVTLAELLSSGRGYRTAAFVSGGNLTRHMGLHRGFATWDEKNEDVHRRLDAALEWLARAEGPPFFLLVHTYQVHAPYVPPQQQAARFTDRGYDGPLRARFERYAAMTLEEAWAGGVGPDYWEGLLDFTDRDVQYLSDLYDAEIAYTDDALRRLIEVALSDPLAASTALIVLSDHGEEFKEHGKYQHDQVFEELVHVPLLIRLPSEMETEGWKGRLAEPVELVDIAPTVADLVGADWSAADWQGTSLVAAMAPGPGRAAVSADRPQFSELTVSPGPKTFRSVTRSGWKYIHCHQLDLDKTWEWLFDLRSDPHESVNLMNSAEADALRAKAELARLLALRRDQDGHFRQALGEQETGTLSEETRAELEQLGYVGGEPRNGK